MPRSSEKRGTVTVELDARSLEALEVLGAGDAAAALLELAHRCADGVLRPGSWERAWVRQVFAVEKWALELESDPDAPWRVRRARPGREP